MSRSVSRPVLFTWVKWIVVVAAMTVGLALVATASAHQLSESKAERVASNHAANLIRSANNDYTSYRVLRCTSGVPHRVNCDIGYDTPETASSRGWACTETLQVLYKAHQENNPRVYKKPISHPC